MRLLDAISAGEGAWISIIGTGGKTTLLYQLGREAQEGGLSCLLTTTTRMLPPDPDVPHVLVGQSPLRGGLCFLSGPAVGGKLTSPTSEQIEQVRREGHFQLVVVEADGSRGLPLKAHAPHEPPIPPQTTCCVAVAGMLALGRPVSQAHRPELLAKNLGVRSNTLVDPPLFVAAVRRYLELGSCHVLVLNQVHDESTYQFARHMASSFPVPRVVLRGEVVAGGVELVISL